MSNYRATFTRYGDGIREISTNTELHGLGLRADFDDAVQYAKALMTGMRAADPTREYELVAVNCGHDLRGSGHYHGEIAVGPGMWDMEPKPVSVAKGYAYVIDPDNRKRYYAGTRKAHTGPLRRFSTRRVEAVSMTREQFGTMQRAMASMKKPAILLWEQVSA